VLFILADVTGSLSVANHRFKGNDAIPLAELKHIHDEMAQTVAVYGEINVETVILQPGQDTIKQIETAFDGALFDVIHFAGHSVRSDTTNDVFLALPGLQKRSAIAYNAEDFARRAAEANARLVILSSCEGASCRALSRMAASGIPAVAGFRWKVDDRDAALFTPALHKALRTGEHPVPVVEAFHEALRAVKVPAQERLTWFSPVLMLQRTVWHDYTLEA
jgi:CHAT domain-containing protein